MKLAFLAQFQWEGGRLYLENLARCILALPSAQRPRVYWYQLADSDIHEEIVGAASVVNLARWPTHGRVERLAQRARRLLAVGGAAAHRVDALFPTNRRLLGRPDVAWIPDFQHEHLPHMFAPNEVESRRLAFQRTARRVRRIVLSSESAAQDFRRLYPNYAERVRILRFATPLTESDLQPSREAAAILASLPRRFAYLPNQFWKHKDHESAFRALGELKRDGVVIPTVCTGSPHDPRHRGWFEHLQSVLSELGLQDQVHFRGLLPRSAQLHLLLNAAVILQPSLFEGWSTVVEDARALQRPMVLSDIDTHREQAPKLTRLFQSGKVEALARELRIAWQSPVAPKSPRVLRAEARSNMQRVAFDALRLFGSEHSSQLDLAQRASRSHQ